jgi:hypothetical protein
MNDFEQMINYLRQDVPLWSKLALHDLLTDALRWAGVGSGAGWAGPGRSGVKGCGPGWGRFRGWGLHTLHQRPHRGVVPAFGVASNLQWLGVWLAPIHWDPCKRPC